MSIQNQSSTLQRETKKILIVAGEASGDLHGSNLVRALKNIDSSLSIYGIGGEELASAGMEIIFHFKDLAVVGISEVAARFPRILKAFRQLKKVLVESPPDLVILIDYPDFNLRLAGIAKKNHVPVFYYISPQIWAWRQKRAKKIAQLVDKMAVIFPFEVPYYEKEGLAVQFVGHPILDQITPVMDSSKALELFKVKNDWPIIALLPGSRKSEIERLLPPILDASAMILKEFPSAQFIIPVAPGIREEDLQTWVKKKRVPVKLIKNQLLQALDICHLALVASGTATLQTAIMKKPMIILYKVSWLTYLIGKMMISVPNIGLANIVAGKKVVPELIQSQANAKRISQEACKLLCDAKLRETIEAELHPITAALGKKGASQRVAEIAYQMVEKQV